MNPAQLGLFDDHGETDLAVDARARMRAMIDRVKAATTPPWTDPMGAILDDGVFQRAMRLVPADEAQRLWAEFDSEMERLDTLWLAANPEATAAP